MRLRAGGPDIPDELLSAQESGNVVFLCGAGVSKGAGLPLFEGLVQHVYEALGETWGDPAEDDARNQNQYDRVLRCLERRLVDPDPNRGQEMRDRILSSVAKGLTPTGNPDLSTHLAILGLSRGPEGRIRVVTTNFDTLFERAWFAEHSQSLASHAGPAMPQPRAAGFEGALHLHGRIADCSIQPHLAQTALVLTSVDFGDAYLRSGWASRYLYDLVRAYTLVLVGYAANDPPLRYILEVLEADRQRFADLNKVYAFAETDGCNEPVDRELWRAKGIESILYNSEGDDHSALYDTIAEWHVYARDPNEWICDRLRSVLSEPPSATHDEDAGSIKRMLVRADPSAVLATVNANPKWLPLLVGTGLFTGSLPAQWIAKRVEDPDMIRACIEVDSVDEDTRSAINRALASDDPVVPPARHRAWRLLIRGEQRQHYQHLQYRWEWEERPLLVSGSEPDTATCHVVADLLRPRASVTRPLPWHLVGDFGHDGEERLLDHLSIAFDPVVGFPPRDILVAWPDSPSANLALFRAVDRAFSDALAEITHDVGDLDHLSSGTVQSVAGLSGHEFGWRSGFRPIASVLVDLLVRIGAHDAVLAKELVTGWAESESVLGCRLALFVSRHVWMPTQNVAAMIVGLSDRVFWADSAEPELMGLLVKRWHEFTSPGRMAIETRLHQGPPRNLYVEDTVADDAAWNAFRDSIVYQRLSHLQDSGSDLGSTANVAVTRWAEENPRWTRGIRERTDDWGRMAPFSGLRGDAGLMEDVPDHKLIGEAKRLEREHPGEQMDLWRVFCRKDPWRALKAIRDNGEQGQWDAVALRSFYWEIADNDDVALHLECTQLAAALPTHVLTDLVGTVSSWVGSQLDTLLQNDGDTCFLELWDRLAAIVYGSPPEATAELEVDRHLLSKALADPGGQLADALVRYAPRGGVSGPSSGFASTFTSRAARIAESSMLSGLFGRMVVVQYLAYLHGVDPAWATRKVVPLLTREDDQANALWWSYLTRGQIGPPGLFNILRRRMLDGSTDPGITGIALDGLVGKVIQVYYWLVLDPDLEYVLTVSDVKMFLRNAPPSGRTHAAWLLWRVLTSEDHDLPTTRAERWRTVVGPMFRGIWPRDLRCRSPEVSRRLVYMALECDEALPDVVDAVGDVLVPYRVAGVHRWLEVGDGGERRPREHVRALLRMASAVIEADAVPGDLGVFLQECALMDPDVEEDPSYIRLRSIRRQSNR